MPTTATAAVVHEPNGEFSFETVELDDPRPDEILLRMEASGVCHTDSMAKGLVPTPCVLGHEGVGVVETVGSDVTNVQPGDRVIVSFPFCGECPNCADGKRYWCSNAYPMLFGGKRSDGTSTIKLNGEPISSAFFQQSSFASHAITLARDVVKVNEGDGTPEMLAALPCGVITGAGAVFNSLQPGPKQSLAVFGGGAVGLSAVMAAKISGVYPLIVVDVVDERLELAKELGATHVFNAINDNVVEGIQKLLPYGVDFVVETSGNVQSFHNALFAVATGGTIGAITMPNYGTSFDFAGRPMIGKAIHLNGIRMGSASADELLPKLIDFNQRGLFPYERLIQYYDFEDINKAFEDSHSGTAIKPVLKMN